MAHEPTSELDVHVPRQVLDHLQQLAGELGTAVLLITHDLALAAERAERLVVLYQGEVVETGVAQKIMGDPQHPYTRRLVAAAPSLHDKPIARPVTPEAPDMIVASGLTKIYRPSRGAPWRKAEVRAVDDVSFRLRRGTTLAIAGESGSGKSTLVRMVLGLLQPSSGTVVFDGLDVSDTASLSHRQTLAFRRRVQPVFQNPYGSLDPMYSVEHIISEPLRIHRIGERGQRQEAVRELGGQGGPPTSLLNRRPRELSGGQRQRVAI